MRGNSLPTALAIVLALAQFPPGAAAQSVLYRVVTPDGKVHVTTTPPPASAGTRVEPIPGTAPTLPGAPMPTPRIGGTMTPQIAPQPMSMGAALASDEMRALRACTSQRHQELELRRAAEELMRTVAASRAPDTGGAAAYRRNLLDSQWRHYQSLGGTAKSPEAVGLPPDPCAAERQAMDAKSNALEAEYRRCAAERWKEVKLSKLSGELAGAAGYLRAVESAPGVLRRGAEAIAGRDPGGKGDPKQIRAVLDEKFREYRALGGPATRLEDVQEIPNPCRTRIQAPSAPAGLRQSRTLPLPQQ